MLLPILLTIFFCLCLAAGAECVRENTHFEINKISIVNAKIKTPFRAVVLADLHNHVYKENNKELIDAIKAQAPDMILVAGDLLTAKPGATLDVLDAFLGAIKDIAPIYYANGNHEYRLKLYPETYGDMADRVEKIMKKHGIFLLVNAAAFLEPFNLRIYGAEIDRAYYKRLRRPKMDAAYLESLLGKIDEASFSILLAHNPEYFARYAAWGADVTLSGHVHGGVVRVPFIKKGLVSPRLQLFPKYDGGEFVKDNKKMIVSRGLGMHTLPLRLFNPAELIVLECKR